MLAGRRRKWLDEGRLESNTWLVSRTSGGKASNETGPGAWMWARTLCMRAGSSKKIVRPAASVLLTISRTVFNLCRMSRSSAFLDRFSCVPGALEIVSSVLPFVKRSFGRASAVVRLLLRCARKVFRASAKGLDSSRCKDNKVAQACYDHLRNLFCANIEDIPRMRK